MRIWNNIISYLNKLFSISSVSVIDIIEIIIIAFVFYQLLMWFKRTRAWALFKGIIIILIIMILASIFQFTTILWIVRNTISVGVIGVIIIFQPELRRALEQLGRGKFFRKLLEGNKSKQRITNQTIEEIVTAVYSMSADHTGALICLERDIPLGEYETTGIAMDSIISRQLLINIFEDKTPLHDGAVMIRDDRIVAATCYFPMSDNLNLNKKYGTRHRAAVGLSEFADAFIIVVSEETGQVSLALSGELIENVTEAELRNRLTMFQNNSMEFQLLNKLGKRFKKDEDKADTSEMADQ